MNRSDPTAPSRGRPTVSQDETGTAACDRRRMRCSVTVRHTIYRLLRTAGRQLASRWSPFARWRRITRAMCKVPEYAGFDSVPTVLMPACLRRRAICAYASRTQAPVRRTRNPCDRYEDAFQQRSAISEGRPRSCTQEAQARIGEGLVDRRLAHRRYKAAQALPKVTYRAHRVSEDSL